MEKLVSIYLQINQIDEGLDGAPGLFLMILFTFLVLLVFLILICALVIILVGLLLGLISLGILSTSILVGLKNKSINSGFRIFFILSNSFISGLFFTGLFWILNGYYNWYESNLIYVFVGILNVIIGVITGNFMYKFFKNILDIIITKLKFLPNHIR